MSQNEAPEQHLGRIPSLDGLRAVSIFLVLLAHLYGTEGYPQSRFFFLTARFGHLGVFIFFIISGFLITKLLLVQKAKTGKISLRTFYTRRFYRILPSHYLVTTCIIVGTWLYGQRIARWNIISAYTFSAGLINRGVFQLGHLWSLAVEEQFYLLWPILLVRFFPYRKWIAITLCLLACLYRNWYWHVGLPEMNMGFSIQTVADFLAGGCLLALFEDDLKAKLPGWFYSLPMTLLVVGLLMFGFLSVHDQGVHNLGVLSILCAATVWILVQRADPILNGRFITAVGRISYALYLVQQPFLNHGAHTIFNRFPINILAVVACAYVLHHGIEQPFIRYGRSRSKQKVRVTAEPTRVSA